MVIIYHKNLESQYYYKLHVIWAIILTYENSWVFVERLEFRIFKWWPSKIANVTLISYFLQVFLQFLLYIFFSMLFCSEFWYGFSTFNIFIFFIV